MRKAAKQGVGESADFEIAFDEVKREIQCILN
jgi:hypothetical protein